MDKELIERLAEESGLVWTSGARQFIGDGSGRYSGPEDDLVKFAALVAEECAKLCDNGNLIDDPSSPESLAVEIRAKFPPPKV